MNAKNISSAAHVGKEEAKHFVEAEAAQEEQKEDDHGDHKVKALAAQETQEFLDILGRADSEEALKQIDSFWDESAFVELLNDGKFLKVLDNVCQGEIRRFRESSVYSVEDLKQDVLARFGGWFPYYRQEASLKTVLKRIAYTQLVDVLCRKKDPCISFEALELEYGDAGIPGHHVVVDVENQILVSECLAKLPTLEEQELFFEYFVENKTVSEIAREIGRTREAVRKRLIRLIGKLKTYTS